MLLIQEPLNLSDPAGVPVRQALSVAVGETLLLPNFSCVL